MNHLSRILEHKRSEVEEAKRRVPLDQLKALAEEQEPPRGFREALLRAEGIALIAEIKAASPSMGDIRPDLDPSNVALEYAAAGAHALSVLTDETFFKGSEANLVAARRACSLPVLRKDFVIDPYQVYESWAMGADALLLIVSALDSGGFRELHGLAQSLHLDVLVEVHDERDTEIALDAKCSIVGVNNRDLSTFETSLETSERLLPHISRFALGVSESGLDSPDKIALVARAGARAVLIGTAFCESPDIRRRVREVMGWA